MWKMAHHSGPGSVPRVLVIEILLSEFEIILVIRNGSCRGQIPLVPR